LKRHIRIGSARAAAALLASIVAMSAMPGLALAGTDAFSAKAGLAPVRQLVGDSTGMLYSLTVKNISSSESIGGVEITVPSGFWSVDDCLTAPLGWGTGTSSARCQFISPAGTSDDIAPGATAQFTFRVMTATSTHDVGGTWDVQVSRTSLFDNAADLVTAVPGWYGLKTRAFSFQITDAVIADFPVAFGDPCPSANRQAEPGSTHTLVICGSNRTTQTQTLKPRYAGLKGTFIHSHGAFHSAPVAPGTTSVVLASWDDVVVTSATGTDMTVLARVRSAAKRSSAWKTLDGYQAGGGATNQPPSVSNEGYLANEDLQLVVAFPTQGLLFNDSDPDGDALSITAVNGSAANVGNATITTQGGSLNVASDGYFTYDPAAEFNGQDSFTYDVSDGTHTGTGTATITVQAVNDPPMATNDSVGTTTTTPIVVTAPGVLDNDTDADGDSLTAILVSGPAHAASFNLSADGSFTFTADSGYEGPDSFTYKANDGSVDSNVATVSITINGTGGGGGGGGGGCLIVC